MTPPIAITPQPATAHQAVTSEQIAAIFAALAAASPAIITLPTPKTFDDVNRFSIVRAANGTGGMLDLTIK